MMYSRTNYLYYATIHLTISSHSIITMPSKPRCTIHVKHSLTNRILSYSGSDNSYPISPLTEMAQSANTRADDDQRSRSSPRSKRANTTNATTTAGTQQQQQQRDTQDLRCWDHGCNGQLFTTLSNLKRHQKEKSSQRPSYPCNMCGAIFSRTTARNHHIQNQSCNRIRRHSNGRVRPNRALRSLTQ